MNAADLILRWERHLEWVPPYAFHHALPDRRVEWNRFLSDIQRQGHTIPATAVSPGWPWTNVTLSQVREMTVRQRREAIALQSAGEASLGDEGVVLINATRADSPRIAPLCEAYGFSLRMPGAWGSALSRHRITYRAIPRLGLNPSAEAAATLADWTRRMGHHGPMPYRVGMDTSQARVMWDGMVRVPVFLFRATIDQAIEARDVARQSLGVVRVVGHGIREGVGAELHLFVDPYHNQ